MRDGNYNWLGMTCPNCKHTIKLFEWGGWKLDYETGIVNGVKISPWQAQLMALLIAAEGKPIEVSFKSITSIYTQLHRLRKAIGANIQFTGKRYLFLIARSK